MKNFEQIKNMNVVEMAEAMTKCVLSVQCERCVCNGGECNPDCCLGILHWLKSEAKE